MAIVHEWGITQIDCYRDLNGVANVPRQAHYAVTTFDDAKPFQVIQNFTDNIEAGNFAFAGLQQADVIAWIKGQIGAEGCAAIEASGAAQLADMENPSIVSPTLPWKSQAEVLADLQQQFTWHVQHFMDQEAAKRGYDNIISACSYAAVDNIFQAEAQSFLTWRSAVWAYCFQQLGRIQNGERAVPTIADFIAELPARV